MDKREIKNKRKIIVFHPALAPYRVDFFNEINKNFEAFFYFNLPNPKEQNFNQESLKSKIEFVCNYLKNGFEFFGRSFRFNVIKLIKQINPDIILCSEYSPITCLSVFYVWFFKKNIKVYTISDDSLSNSKERKGIRSFIRSTIASYIDGVIFTNDEVANWYKMNVSKKPKTLILPIIHNELVFKLNLQHSIDKANSNIESYNLLGKKIILYVGRLVQVKNVSLLINTISKINQDDIRLVIVGDGNLKVDLEKQVKELSLEKKVLFIGKQENESLFNWYTFSNIFVLPSVYEPFGAVVNEALIGGCYVLCSSVAGASSLINSNNGILFDPTNEMELTGKLQFALNNTDPLITKLEKLRANKIPFEFNQIIKTLIKQF